MVAADKGGTQSARLQRRAQDAHGSEGRKSAISDQGFWRMDSRELLRLGTKMRRAAEGAQI